MIRFYRRDFLALWEENIRVQSPSGMASKQSPVPDSLTGTPMPGNPAWRYNPLAARTPSPRPIGWPPSPLVFPHGFNGDETQTHSFGKNTYKSSASSFGVANFIAPQSNDGSLVPSMVTSVDAGKNAKSSPSPIFTPPTKLKKQKTPIPSPKTFTPEDSNRIGVPPGFSTPIRKRSPAESFSLESCQRKWRTFCPPKTFSSMPGTR